MAGSQMDLAQVGAAGVTLAPSTTDYAAHMRWFWSVVDKRIADRKSTGSPYPEFDQVQERNILLSRALTTDYQPPVPSGLTLFPFQRAGVEYTIGKRFVMIYDEMGTGKTIQAIVALNTRPNRGRVLVVCPATARENWCREFSKWATWKTTVCEVNASTTAIPESANVVVVNYDILWRRDFFGSYDTVIADEAHRAKNKSAKRTRAVFRHFRSATTIFALSGAPITRDVTDLHTMISVGIPEIEKTFISEYTVPVVKSFFAKGGEPRESVSYQVKDAPRLGKLLRSRCMLRRLKKDVLPQLPPRIYQVVNPPDIRFKTDEKLLAYVSRKLESTNDYLRAVGFSPDMEIEGHIATVRREQATSKAPYVADHVEQLLQQDPSLKVVVFAYHKDVISILVERLGSYGCVSITGDTPTKARQTLVDSFQHGTKTRVFIGNIDAAGEAITLTAASLAVFAEVDWVWTKIDQAECRLDRIGQKGNSEGNVLVQHVIAHGSVDELLVNAMLSKKRQSEAVLS